MKKEINNHHTSQNFAYMIIHSKNTAFSDVTNVTERHMAFILELEKIFIFHKYASIEYVIQFLDQPEK